MKQVPPGKIPAPSKTAFLPRIYTYGFVSLAAAAIVFAVGLHIYRMSGMAFTNYDDMLMGLTADRMRTQGWWASYLDLARTYAVWQGRIYFYFSMIFFVLPFLIRSLVLRAVLSTLLQLGAACSAGAVVGLYAGFRGALLFVALACAWMPYWPAVSPINGFPFVYHLPVLLFFSGLAVYILRARGHGVRWRCPAAIFPWSAFFISLFFYEALIPLFFLIAMTVSAAEVRRARGTWDRGAIARAWAPWLAGFAVWAGIYLGFRKLHPGTYGGSALAGLGHGELGRAATSLFYFETYSLPGANWIGNLHYTADRMSGSPDRLGYVAFFFRNLTGDGIVLAVLLAAMLIFCALEWRRESGEEDPSPRSAGKAVAALALACALMCPLPLAFTAKYRDLDMVLALAPYLPGYYSYLAWCAVAALAFPLALSALRRIPSLRWTATVVIAILCAAVSAASAMTDDAIYRNFSEASDKWKLVDQLARTGWLATLPPQAVVLAPGLWDNFPHTSWYHGDAYWTAYFSAWAGRPVPVIRIPRQVPELLRRHTPVFYCEHQWLAGRLDSVLAVEPVVSISPAGDAVSDSALLLSRSLPAGMEVQYRSAASGPLRARIPAWRREHGAYIARLALPDLLAGTLQVTDGAGAPPPGPIVDFGRGFSGVTEHNPSGHYWRWSDGADGEGEINLVNLSAQPVTVRFRASLHFDPGPEGSMHRAAFDIHTSQGSESLTLGAGDMLERAWRLSPGSNRIRIQCHAGRMSSPGDARYIVFGVWDWSVTPVEENP